MRRTEVLFCGAHDILCTASCRARATCSGVSPPPAARPARTAPSIGLALTQRSVAPVLAVLAALAALVSCCVEFGVGCVVIVVSLRRMQTHDSGGGSRSLLETVSPSVRRPLKRLA